MNSVKKVLSFELSYVALYMGPGPPYWHNANVFNLIAAEIRGFKNSTILSFLFIQIDLDF